MEAQLARGAAAEAVPAPLDPRHGDDGSPARARGYLTPGAKRGREDGQCIAADAQRGAAAGEEALNCVGTPSAAFRGGAQQQEPAAALGLVSPFWSPSPSKRRTPGCAAARVAPTPAAPRADEDVQVVVTPCVAAEPLSAGARAHAAALSAARAMAQAAADMARAAAEAQARADEATAACNGESDAAAAPAPVLMPTSRTEPHARGWNAAPLSFRMKRAQNMLQSACATAPSSAAVGASAAAAATHAPSSSAVQPRSILKETSSVPLLRSLVAEQRGAGEALARAAAALATAVDKHAQAHDAAAQASASAAAAVLAVGDAHACLKSARLADDAHAGTPAARKRVSFAGCD